MIRFLFKSCIILCALFIALSFFLPAGRRAQNHAAAETQSAAGVLAAVSAFGAVIGDIDGFCSRNPQSCATGKTLFAAMREKAGQGAAFAYQWLRGGLDKGAENTERHLAEEEASASAGKAAENKLRQSGRAPAESAALLPGPAEKTGSPAKETPEPKANAPQEKRGASAKPARPAKKTAKAPRKTAKKTPQKQKTPAPRPKAP